MNLQTLLKEAYNYKCGEDDRSVTDEFIEEKVKIALNPSKRKKSLGNPIKRMPASYAKEQSTKYLAKIRAYLQEEYPGYKFLTELKYDTHYISTDIAARALKWQRSGYDIFKYKNLYWVASPKVYDELRDMINETHRRKQEKKKKGCVYA